MDNKRIAELLNKKLSGEISLPEQRELTQLAENMDKEQTLLNIFGDFVDTRFALENDMTEQETEEIVNRLAKKLKTTKTQTEVRHVIHNNRTIRFLAIAASLIIICSISILYFYTPYSKTKSQNIVATKKGSKTNLVLPDGTQVWINADTKLTYDKTFGEQTREINLSGEAYFDVVKDKEHPFIVHTNTIDVKALGTAFNVRCYTDESNAQATLLRGAIEVSLTNDHGRKIVLKPNEKVVVQNQVQAVNKKYNRSQLILEQTKSSDGDSSTLDVQWMQNRLAFDQNTLEDIAVSLERWYNIKVVIRNPSLKERRISGVFEDKSLQRVMEALKLAGRFNYTINENNAVTIE